MWGRPPGDPWRASIPCFEDTRLPVTGRGSALAALTLPRSDRRRGILWPWAFLRCLSRGSQGSDDRQAVYKAHPPSLHPPSSRWAEDQGADRGRGGSARAVPLPSRGHQLFWLHPCVSYTPELLVSSAPFPASKAAHSLTLTLPPSFSSRCSTLSRRPVKATDEGMSSPRLPLDATDRSQNVWQWILESERQGKHKPHR